MNVREFLLDNILVLDGAMGTMLQSRGLKAGELPEVLNLTSPHIIEAIHREYLQAGSNVIFTNTFGANAKKLKGYSVREIVDSAVETAKRAAREFNGLAALDIGPIGELMEPMGTLKFEEAYEIFKEQVLAGANADLIFIETMTDLLEMKCAVLAAKENSSLPIFATMTFESNMRTFVGTSLSSMAVTLEGLGVDALGINCSLGPKEMVSMVEELIKWSSLPIIVKPNAGIPSFVNGEAVFNLGEDEFCCHMERLLDLGVSVVGGCCGTTPKFIQSLAQKAKNRKPLKRERVIGSAVCSYAKTVVIDSVKIIGERINPTGKKRFQEALMSRDIDYVVAQAIEQVEAGADILDVNVGLPQVDEKALMVEVVKNIQSIVDAPLQIDSSKPSVLEAALRIYSGKPIVNSVNGEPEMLSQILPLVKKYGAAVVGLTLDKNGIPRTAVERYKIAERIVSTAQAYGIAKEDIFIDCLTLTAGAEQEIAYETLEALSLVKNRLGVKTLLGVSNISFGLPGRDRLNQVFLSLALGSGLDLPIINPNNREMVDTIFCFNQLKNIDKGSNAYLQRFGQQSQEIKAKGGVASEKSYSLSHAIEKGLKNEAAAAAEELLKGVEGLQIVNEHLIPALDAVGKNYEQGRIFLPQLLQSAEAAKSAFEVIRKKLPPSSQAAQNTAILATVKGDIHDIGKNIVKVVMENYGYRIIDLGRDVEIKTVVDTALAENARLVGLSALMTTTVENMEKTIQSLREADGKIQIMVGGAVLTEGLAKKIGADYYARDAMEAVSIAREIFA